MGRQETEAVRHFVKSSLEILEEISMQNTKAEIMAYIEAVKSEVKSVNYIINLQMGLFKERVAYKPFEYPDYYTEGWLKQAQAFWLHTEIPMQ